MKYSKLVQFSWSFCFVEPNQYLHTHTLPKWNILSPRYWFSLDGVFVWVSQLLSIVGDLREEHESSEEEEEPDLRDEFDDPPPH